MGLTRVQVGSEWKRLECNRLFKFEEITEENFESILRRCAVIRIFSKFFEPIFLERHLPDHEKYGIFKREEDAKDFLTSKQGVVAGLRLQQVFSEKHSEAECRRIVQEYTRCGGDNGVTEKYIRQAPREFDLVC